MREHGYADSEVTLTAADVIRVKHQNGTEWVLVLPDPARPLFNVYAEAKDDDRAWSLVHEYAAKLERLQAS